MLEGMGEISESII